MFDPADGRRVFIDDRDEILSGRAVRADDCTHDDECDCELVSLCPACGDAIDYCQGHGEIGDPAGYAQLLAHDNGKHDDCSITGCDWAYQREQKEPIR